MKLEDTLRLLSLSDLTQMTGRGLMEGLTDLGYEVGCSQSQILAIPTGSDVQTEIIRDALEERNIFGSVFCYPATRRNKAVISPMLNNSLRQYLFIVSSISFVSSFILSLIR